MAWALTLGYDGLMRAATIHPYLCLASSIIFAVGAIWIAAGGGPNQSWRQFWWLGAGLYGVGAVAWLIMAIMAFRQRNTTNG
jgi:hypothetical protein